MRIIIFIIISSIRISIIVIISNNTNNKGTSSMNNVSILITGGRADLILWNSSLDWSILFYKVLHYEWYLFVDRYEHKDFFVKGY